MLSFDEMLRKLETNLTVHRLKHSMGVMDTALRLGKAHGADAEKCRLSGLLHDCAKSLSTQDMLLAISRQHIQLYRDEDKYPQLLHAPAGSAVAFEEYGVTDCEVLDAIRRHTVGAPEMGLLDKIIYVSDLIEPNRQSFDGLEDIRRLALEDIDKAYRACAESTRQYCLSKGMPVFSF